MVRILLATLAMLCASCTSEQMNQTSDRHDRHATKMTGQHDHGYHTPETIRWQDGPSSLPPGAQFAVLEGDPKKSGYFAMRLKLPDGYRIGPHWHPKYERLTILTGTLHLGMGEQVGSGEVLRLTPGSYGYMPPGMRHYAHTEGETILQLNTMGPWDIIYLNPEDDPRKNPQRGDKEGAGASR